MIPIKICHHGDLQTVYVEKVTIDGIWGRHSSQKQDTKLWPNRNVRILKIGSQKVQTWAEFQREKSDYYDMIQTIKAEKKKQLYKDAYRHGKKYKDDGK